MTQCYVNLMEYNAIVKAKSEHFLFDFGNQLVQVHFMDFPGSVDVHLASYAVPGLAKTL